MMDMRHSRKLLRSVGYVAAMVCLVAWSGGPAQAFLSSSEIESLSFEGQFIDLALQRPVKSERSLKDEAPSVLDSMTTAAGGFIGGIGSLLQGKVPPTASQAIQSGAKYLEETEKLTENGLLLHRTEGHGLVPLPAVTKYLNNLLAEVSKGWPRDLPKMQVYLSPFTDMRANAYRDGTIVVRAGLLREMENESQLAFVLAHEAAHVMLQHFEDDNIVDWQKEFFGTINRGADLVAAVQDMRGQRQGKQGRGEKTRMNVHAVGALAGTLTNRLLLPSWNQEQEVEADLLATDLLARAGIRVTGGEGFMDKEIERDRQETAARGITIQQAVTVMQEMLAHHKQGSSDVVLAEAYLRNLNFLAGDVIGQYFGDHPEPIKRRETLAAYARDRVERSQRRVSSESFAAMKNDAGLKRLLSVPGKYTQAVEMYRRGDKTAAEKEAGQIISGGLGKLGWSRVFMARFRESQGKAGQGRALKNLEIAAKETGTYGAHLAVHQRLIDGYLKAGNVSQATAAAQRAFKEFHEPAALYPVLVDISLRRNDRGTAQKVMRRCREFGEDALYNRCREKALFHKVRLPE